jgi:hypothetical protein
VYSREADIQGLSQVSVQENEGLVVCGARLVRNALWHQHGGLASFVGSDNGLPIRDK